MGGSVLLTGQLARPTTHIVKEYESMDELNSVIQILSNFGVSAVMLAYFIYRDNKFMSTLDVTLKTLQDSVDTLIKYVEKDKKE